MSTHMKRPRIVVFSVATVDGRIALGPDRLIIQDSQTWKDLCGPGADVIRQQILSTEAPQVILEGSGTFVREGDLSPPLLPSGGESAALYSNYLPTEVLHRPGHAGWYAVVDSRGRCRWEFKEQSGWHLLVLVAKRTPSEYLAYLRDKLIPYLVVGEDRVNLVQAATQLATRLGVRCILSESGGGLNGALLRAGLVDEVNLVTVPALIGGRSTPTVFDGPDPTIHEVPTRLVLLSTQPQPDGNIWTRYRVQMDEGS
jgi:2,5-diamino-6-(ribosylamino)-4(3H)-pyrimidinone 5'-phosphate reductase